jgi:hypothetical protein
MAYVACAIFGGDTFSEHVEIFQMDNNIILTLIIFTMYQVLCESSAIPYIDSVIIWILQMVKLKYRA